MRTNLTYLRVSLIVAPILTLSACGGGGGGSSPNYSGSWAFQGTKVLDTCRSTLPNVSTANLVVTQDGSAVTVQAGSLTLTGSVNDKDGFDALVTRPGTNGCTQAASLVFTNASDGTADAGLAFAAQCGNITCTVGYAGGAVRGATSSFQDKATASDLEELAGALNKAAEVSDTGVEGGLLSAIEEAQLELARE